MNNALQCVKYFIHRNMCVYVYKYIYIYTHIQFPKCSATAIFELLDWWAAGAFNICCPRDCVSRHNGGTSGAPLKPLRVDSALRALSTASLGIMGAPEVRFLPHWKNLIPIAGYFHKDCNPWGYGLQFRGGGGETLPLTVTPHLLPSPQL